MNPTDPRPTPRRRRWRRLLVCGVLGLNVGIFLGGLFLDEFPPDDADLAPREVPPFDGASNPFERPDSEITFFAPEGGLPSEYWFIHIDSLDRKSREALQDDPRLREHRDRHRDWCTVFEHEFSRVGGDPWAEEPDLVRSPHPFEFGPRGDGTVFLEPTELRTLARLEWQLGNPEATIHWSVLHFRVVLFAMARAESCSQWTRSLDALSTGLEDLSRWIQLGLWQLVPRIDPGSIVVEPVAEERGLRLFHRATVEEVSTAEGLADFLWVPRDEFRGWHWKPIRFRRRLGELIRPVIEDPSASIEIEADSRWVRAWIDPYGARALERSAEILRAERTAYRRTTIALALLPVSAAVQAFEDDRLEWPETLEDLVPTYLSEIPAALAAPAVVEFDLADRELRVRERAGAVPTHRWTLPAEVR